MSTWDRSLCGMLVALAAVIVWSGCATPSPRNVADQRVVDREIAPSQRLQTDAPEHEPRALDEIERAPQADGERYGGVRPPIPRRFKEFLQQRVFGYAPHGLRIEMPRQSERSIVSPIFWINPVEIPREHIYGSDVTLITDSHPNHYSPRDIEALNTRRTVTLVPVGLLRDQLIGGQRVDLLPGDTIVQRRVPIFTNHAFVHGVTAFDHDRDYLGYLLTPQIHNPESERHEVLNIYYTGAVSGEAAQAVPQRIDVLIVPTTEPSRISTEEILDFARKVEARVIVPLGRHLPEGAAVIEELAEESEIPLWIPPDPPERPEPRPAG